MIYVVEDDKSIRELVAYALGSAGYETESYTSSAEFFAALVPQRARLVVLDIMLPGEDGLAILRRLRETPETAAIPVMIMSALGTELDKVRGLDLGADDYIAKPFRPRELVSRIRSVLRRTGRAQSVLDVGPLRVDTERACVSKNGQELSLSALEYRLLMTLANHAGQVLSRNQLLESIWDVSGDFVNDNTLTVYIKRLREKVEGVSDQWELKTVWGVGYKFEVK